MKNIEWENAANSAFNYYFRAVRKGENYDTAAAWFRDEIAEQMNTAGLEFEDTWELNISPASLQVMVATLAARLKSLNHDAGYEVNPEFYGAFLSFFSDIICDRADENRESFNQIQLYWDGTLCNELPGG